MKEVSEMTRAELERELRLLRRFIRRRLGHAKISRVLAGELETTALTPEERAIWSKRFLAQMAEPGPEEEAYYAELRESGKAVGLGPPDDPDMEA
ncbi:MAG: hypothetical protein ACU0E9_12050 [Limimaricola soesokkakensis]|uniref:hypothetical protein n=1 Tax=Limimaricola soesokkakensis TaxID=1343159 RepID=UPI004058B1C1